MVKEIVYPKTTPVQKKNAVVLKKRMERLDRYVGGLKRIRSVPRIIVIVDQTIDFVAAQECFKLEIPLICRLDTDCDPNFVKVGVPINDDSNSSICVFLQILLLSIQKSHIARIAEK